MHILVPWEQLGEAGEGKRIDKAEGGWSVHCPSSNLLQEINFPLKRIIYTFDVDLRDIAVGVDDVHVGGDGDVDGGAARHAGVPVRPGVRPGHDTQVAVGHLRISIQFQNPGKILLP